MTAYEKYGTDASVTITPEGGSPVTMSIQSGQVELERKTVPLQGCGTTVDIARAYDEQRVKVTMDVIKHDAAIEGGMLGSYSGTTGALYDSSIPEEFTVVFTEPTRVSGKNKVTTVSNVIFEKVPICKFKRGEWSVWTYEGYGTNVSTVNPA